jgi:hypothetical protein
MKEMVQLNCHSSLPQIVLTFIGNAARDEIDIITNNRVDGEYRGRSLVDA